MSKWLKSLAVVAVAATGPLEAEAAGGRQVSGCYPDWSAASPVVQSELLTPARELHSHVRSHNLGDVVRITLCFDNGRYIYRLLLREPSGNIGTLIVDARKPF